MMQVVLVVIFLVVGFILLYLHYKRSEHRAYERWRTDTLALNPGLTLPERPAWEFPAGEGPNANSFYL